MTDKKVPPALEFLSEDDVDKLFETALVVVVGTTDSSNIIPVGQPVIGTIPLLDPETAQPVFGPFNGRYYQRDAILASVAGKVSLSENTGYRRGEMIVFSSGNGNLFRPRTSWVTEMVRRHNKGPALLVSLEDPDPFIAYRAMVDDHETHKRMLNLAYVSKLGKTKFETFIDKVKLKPVIQFASSGINVAGKQVHKYLPLPGRHYYTGPFAGAFEHASSLHDRVKILREERGTYGAYADHDGDALKTLKAVTSFEGPKKKKREPWAEAAIGEMLLMKALEKEGNGFVPGGGLRETMKQNLRQKGGISLRDIFGKN